MAREVSVSRKMGKGQAGRLSAQHIDGGGVVGIFGEDAQIHDADIRNVAEKVLVLLRKEYPYFDFRMRNSIKKQEIHDKLRAVDSRLGGRRFV